MLDLAHGIQCICVNNVARLVLPFVHNIVQHAEPTALWLQE